MMQTQIPDPRHAAIAAAFAAVEETKAAAHAIIAAQLTPGEKIMWTRGHNWSRGWLHSVHDYRHDRIRVEHARTRVLGWINFTPDRLRFGWDEGAA